MAAGRGLSACSLSASNLICKLPILTLVSRRAPTGARLRGIAAPLGVVVQPSGADRSPTRAPDHHYSPCYALTLPGTMRAHGPMGASVVVELRTATPGVHAQCYKWRVRNTHARQCCAVVDLRRVTHHAPHPMCGMLL